MKTRAAGSQMSQLMISVYMRRLALNEDEWIFSVETRLRGVRVRHVSRTYILTALIVPACFAALRTCAARLKRERERESPCARTTICTIGSSEDTHTSE